MPKPKYAIGIKTFMREKPILNCIHSIEENLKNYHIYIADDSETISEDKQILYNKLKKEGHIIIRLPFDVGISKGRNEIVKRVKEKYMLYLDDDFVITPDNNFEKIIDILEQRPDIGLITGCLIYDNHPTGYEFNLSIRDRTIFKEPLTSEWEKYGKLKIRRTDLGLNFFICRIKMLKEIKWDERFIIFTEHLDFFLQVKQSHWKVYYCPEMRSIHDATMLDREYAKYRHRKFHWKYFANKWNVDWCQEGDIRINYRTE